LDDADFFVRLGDLYRPTAPGDLDSGGDWVPAVLVEELVFVNGEEIISSEVHEALTEETPW
jgi:hypothetical protein